MLRKLSASVSACMRLERFLLFRTQALNKDAQIIEAGGQLSIAVEEICAGRERSFSLVIRIVQPSDMGVATV